MAEEVSTQVPADDFQAPKTRFIAPLSQNAMAREARARGCRARDAPCTRATGRAREEEVETMRRDLSDCARSWRTFASRVEKMPQQINETIAEEQQVAS